MKTRSATAIIGANFGDEGKGLAVDAMIGRNPDAAVIRFNGGAQAGHTVVSPDGRRHVFSHFGAGSFRGAATFLSRFFVVQPHLFALESAELAATGLRPRVYIDPDAQVTTPFDVFINRWLEEARAGARHGSVGVGFGETLERAGRGHPLTVRDLGDDRTVMETLHRIRDAWLPSRLASLGVPFTAERRNAAADPAVVRRYVAKIDVLRNSTTPAPIDAVLTRPNLVFEGAQGLLLDMDRGLKFPHVTRSNTGLRNVLALAADAGIGNLDVVYMTRAYLTRHGAGPLPNEVPRLAFADVVDPTNLSNSWQGALRFAPLDLDLLRTTIADDLSDAAAAGIKVDAGVGVTCVDQVRHSAEVVASGIRTAIPKSRLARQIAAAVGLPLRLEAHGPRLSAADLVSAAAEATPAHPGPHPAEPAAVRPPGKSRTQPDPARSDTRQCV
ncbi:MAG: adenylosuccinate synthetase [Alphaproteobacteria bacterium]|nr:adenylosuccinate synthetase [Alphaproteobacteria bacterium]